MTLFFAGNFPAVLEFGHIILISGRGTPNGSRIDFNLAKGKKPENDIGLHLSCRFDENVIVRNSYDGGWGREERLDNKEDGVENVPFRKGEDFTIYILVGDYGFNIAINGEPYCSFEHRLSYGDLKALTIYYDLQMLHGVDFRRAYPSPHPIIQCSDDTVEFSQDLPCLPTPGHVIVLSAVPYGSNGRFELQMNQGCNTDKEALHVSVRFDENCVVRNNRSDEGYWGDEDGDGAFPFVLNQLFRIAIGFGEHGFRIAINGQYYCDFPYRTDDIFEDFNGFTIACDQGLHLLVRGVDHMLCASSDLNGFHTYSNPYDLLVSNIE